MCIHKLTQRTDGYSVMFGRWCGVQRT